MPFYRGRMEDLTDVDTLALLERGEIAHLAVISDGEPYVSPISYVIFDGMLAFRTGPGRRLSALSGQGRATVVVTDYDSQTGGWESAMLWGTPVTLPDGPRKERVIGLLLEKYRNVLGSPLSFSGFSPMSGLTDVVAVSIDVMSGRSSGSGLSTRTRPGRL